MNDRTLWVAVDALAGSATAQATTAAMMIVRLQIFMVSRVVSSDPYYLEVPGNLFLLHNIQSITRPDFIAKRIFTDSQRARLAAGQTSRRRWQPPSRRRALWAAPGPG